MIRLAVAGAEGRMGQCVLVLASSDARFSIAARLDRSSSRSLPPCDVLIDFTDAVGTIEWLEICASRRVAMVIGATGHDAAALAQIAAAAKVIPIAQAANFSIGMQSVLKAVAAVAKELGEGYDVEIVETHHRHKLDAPSGTALTIADAIRAARVEPLRTRSASDGPVILGRSGRTAVRPRGQIAIHAVRMGEVIGKHEIHFSGPGETITLTHAAQSREAFAAGALRAAAWIVGEPPRLYAMSDVT